MKYRVPMITTCLLGASLLAVATFTSIEQKTLAAQPPADPAYTANTAHSAHAAADPSQAGGQQPIEAQMAELRARIQQLETRTQQQSAPSPPSGAMPMGAENPAPMKPMPGMEPGGKPMQGMAGMKTTGGKGGMGGGPDVTGQLAELRSKVRQLETTLQRQSGSASGAMPMGGQPGMGSGAKPKPGAMAGMSGMGAPGATKPAGGMSGMGAASPPSGEMGMMAMKMDKMMGMMGKMMGGMGGGAMPAAAAPMAGGGMAMMDDDMMEMGGMSGGAKPAAAAPMAGGGMPMMDDDMMEMSGGAKPAAAAPMAGGGMPMMDDDMMEMAGMMGKMDGMGAMGGKSSGKGGSSKAMSSAQPGLPGASHLYHLGATGFFLDHRRHIALSTEQTAKLNQIKEQAALDKASANRNAQQAEQELWTLTAAEELDNDQIEAKVAEIEKIKGDARVRFITAVGDATKVLNEGQRMSLTGFAPPASAPPAAAPMPGGMSDM